MAAFFALAGCLDDGGAERTGPSPRSDAAGFEGETVDAGALDAGALDAGSLDAGSLDAGSVDAGSVEAGANDGANTDRPRDAGVLDAGTTDGANTDGPRDAGADDAGGPAPGWFRVMTFNTGTATNLPHDDDGDLYASNEAALADEHYGNGLAWRAAIAGTAARLDELAVDLVAFQEIFDPRECATIPDDALPGFVCEEHEDGGPSVAQRVLGAGFQVACHLGKADKCLAVRRAKGRFVGCEHDLCLDFLDGAAIDGCGGGSRVGRGVVEWTDGSRWTVVSFHGTSGASGDDIQCREDQIEQVFDDLDGEPAANGAINLVLGDFNTDPGRLTLVDNSADRLTDKVGGNNAFRFVNEVGFGAEPTYAGRLNIDHVVTDVLEGSCVAVGGASGPRPVLDTVYFDHQPLLCDLR